MDTDAYSMSSINSTLLTYYVITISNWDIYENKALGV